MKSFTIAIIILVAFLVYKFLRSEHIISSGNTTPDDKKNVNILNPQLTNGKVIQTDGSNANDFQNTSKPLFQNYIPINNSDLALTTDKLLATNDNSISAVANVRVDSITPLAVASDIGLVPVQVDGSRYGSNLPDSSLLLQVPPTRIQNFVPLDTSARVNDGFTIQPSALDYSNDMNIPAIA